MKLQDKHNEEIVDEYAFICKLIEECYQNDETHTARYVILLQKADEMREEILNRMVMVSY